MDQSKILLKNKYFQQIALEATTEYTLNTNITECLRLQRTVQKGNESYISLIEQTL